MTTAQELDERYGRTRRRRGPWIVFGAIVAVVIVVAVWLTAAKAMDNVNSAVLGFDVPDEHSVSVRFQVTVGADRDVYCAIEALDEDFGVVGWRVVEVPQTGGHSRELTESVPTVSLATTGLVNTCWVA